MTDNRSAKKAARAAAAATGTSYASARHAERTTWAKAMDEHTELVRFWESSKGVVLGGVVLAVGRRTARFSELLAAQRSAQPPADVTGIAEAAEEIASTPEEWEEKFAGFAAEVDAAADRALGPFDREAASAEVAAEQAAAVKAVTTFAVTTAMVEVVTAAAATMPVETVERSDVPAANGFAYLDEPFRLIDDSGRGHPQRAFHWVVAGNQVQVVCYRGRHDYADGEEPLSPQDESILPSLAPGIEWVWRFGDPSFGNPAVEADPDVPQAARFLKALWTISAQRLAAVADARPDRQTCRRAQRAGVLTAGLVKVVELRRTERSGEAEPDKRTVDWSHRWLVEGHWRNQYLPSCGLHRQQWISTHVKGPEGLPLVVKPSVFHVSR